MQRIHTETVAILARYQEFLPLLEAGTQNGDVSKVREIAAAIESHEPGNFVTQWYAAQADLRDGDTESAAAHMDAVGICPGGDDEGNSLIEHVAWATIFAYHQASAIKRGVPTMMITALPKSASASISYLLAELLDCPVARCSFPGYMHATVVPG